MLRYKVLKTGNDQEIPLSLSTSNIDKTNISDEDLYDSIINPPVSLEKESYKPKTSYKINFKFYNNGYDTDFNKAGFNLPTDINKNVYKKSLFLLEFYDNLTSKNRVFSDSLSVYPNVLGFKGPVSTSVNGIRTVKSIYDITIPQNELYFIFNYRNFSNFTNTKLDQGVKYASMYLKTMFLNAKTGEVQYFIADTDTNNNILSSSEVNDDLFYYEIRFYENYTYAFYKNGLEQTNIFFKELVVQ